MFTCVLQWKQEHLTICTIEVIWSLLQMCLFEKWPTCTKQCRIVIINHIHHTFCFTFFQIIKISGLNVQPLETVLYMYIFWSKVEKTILLIICVACSHILMHPFHMNPATMTFCLIDGAVRRMGWAYSGFIFSLARGMWWAKCADITLCVPSQGWLAPQVLIAYGPMTKLGFETRTAFLRSMFRSHHAQITISGRCNELSLLPSICSYVLGQFKISVP